MYVIKVGSFYVKHTDTRYCGYLNEILLSNETMTGFVNKKVASEIAKKINGKVVKIKGDLNNENV